MLLWDVFIPVYIQNNMDRLGSLPLPGDQPFSTDFLQKVDNFRLPTPRLRDR